MVDARPTCCHKQHLCLLLAGAHAQQDIRSHHMRVLCVLLLALLLTLHTSCAPPPAAMPLATLPATPTGGELVYFEMDQLGQLLELAKKDMDGDVSCLDIAPVLAGALRCRWGDRCS
jgi:hypothetical protein